MPINQTNRKLKQAAKIEDPAQRANALAALIGSEGKDPLRLAKKAAAAAAECVDPFEEAMARKSEIDALVALGLLKPATQSLKEALSCAQRITLPSSKSVALFRLMPTAVRISRKEAETILMMMETQCPADRHWRCEMNLRDARSFLANVDA